MAKFLIVDDEDEVRDAIARRLKREGYEVVTASSAVEARERIIDAKPGFDVVVTDMSMEDADSGLTVLREAVTSDLFTEVIVLTAYGNVANAVESMRQGAFDYLEKNVPGVDIFELLVLKVEQALERRRASISAIRRMEDLASRVRR